MARRSKAQHHHDELERQALAFFRRTLSELPDPSRPQGVRHPLHAVVVIALMAMVCGADDAEAMQLWGEANEQWLASVLELPHGVPTQDVFLSVFAALDPEAFSQLFRAWMRWLKVQLAAQDKHIAIDGKSSRRSFDTSRQQPALHTVSAWMSEAGLVLAQCKTQDKSNEIEAIPRLLQRLDLRGASVTIDAMGCQTAIADAIVEAQGPYLLAVKDNQPTLRQDIEKTFDEAADDRRRSVDELEQPKVDVFETLDKAHGRVEKRTVSMSRDL